MKRTIIAALAGVLFLAACNPGSKKDETTVPGETKKTDTAMVKEPQENKEPEQLYGCPMHPEVTGKKDTKCPKCGMKLTEPVKKTNTP